MASFQDHLLVAYCGTPHASSDINGRWIRQFLAGENRDRWIEIIDCTNRFVKAIQRREIGDAARAMNRETDHRLVLTPDVLDAVGHRLNDAARTANCGARFTGAGGGGCIWAIGDTGAIRRLRDRWADIVNAHASAHLLEAAIDPEGVRVNTAPAP
jgi:D-glycero-alpha-D-manno-heptose-7-phosphate kinase